MLPMMEVRVDGGNNIEGNSGTNLSGSNLRGGAELSFHPNPFILGIQMTEPLLLHTILPSHYWPNHCDNAPERLVNKKFEWKR